MKIRLLYKSFNTMDKTYYKGDVIDDPQAQEWLDLFPTWFEKVEGGEDPMSEETVEEVPVEEVPVEEPTEEVSVEEVPVEEPVEDAPETKKVPKMRKM